LAQNFLLSELVDSFRTVSQYVDYAIKSIKKLDWDILDLLDKSKTLGHCGFPLANPQKMPMIYFVPESIELINYNYCIFVQTI